MAKASAPPRRRPRPASKGGTRKPATKRRPGDGSTTTTSAKTRDSKAVATATSTVGRPESVSVERATGHRWWPRYDTQRPHVRLGVLWFVAVIVALAGGVFTFAVPYAAAAALGAAQAARAWRRAGLRPNVAVAAAVAAGLPVATALGSRGAGAAVLVGVAVSVLAAGGSLAAVLRDAGCTIRCWLPVGVAAASAVAIARIDLGAALALVILISAYDCGDYLVGADARWPVVGTLAGMAAVAVLSFSLFVVALPPFGGADVFVFGATLALLAPLGQIVASLSLPDGRVLASGLRRLDTLMLVGPVWVALLMWYPLD